MESLMSNEHFWTIVGGALSGFVGAMAPIVVARIQATQAARQRAMELKDAAKEREKQVREAAEKAAKELQATAEASRLQVKAAARKDALDEWQCLYGEKQKEAAQLRADMAALQTQNAGQQAQIDVLTGKHTDCEERHAALEARVEVLNGTVTKIANGH